MELREYEKIAARIRMDVIEEIHSAGSGHPGGSLSAADIVTALYFREMRVDPQNPRMKGRDKFVLSKGHAAPVQYAALAEKGFFPARGAFDAAQAGQPPAGTSEHEKTAGHRNVDRLAGTGLRRLRGHGAGRQAR